MGALCNTGSNNANIEINLVEEYKDVVLKRYKSSNDSYYDIFEKQHNLLKYIRLCEYSILFNSFNFDPHKTGEILQKKRLFIEDLEKNELISFFKAKIINHHILNSYKGSNTLQIFLEFIIKLFEVVGKGLLSYIRINNKKGGVQLTDKKVKKYFLVAVGILFCSSDNLEKIDYIFHAFCNEKEKLEPGLQFEIFLYILCLSASFAGICSIQEVSKAYPIEVHAVAQNDYMKTLETYEVTDIVTVKDNFVKNMFSGVLSLNYNEYREKISTEEFDWILTGPGIRTKLESKLD
jgi:hypothetical protein